MHVEVLVLMGCGCGWEMAVVLGNRDSGGISVEIMAIISRVVQE